MGRSTALYYLKRLWHRHRETIELFFVGFWSFWEATLWFLIPDMVLAMWVWRHPHRKLEGFFWCVTGSALGMAVMFVLCGFFVSWVDGWLWTIPGTHSHQLATIAPWLRFNLDDTVIPTPPGVIYQPWSLIPVKVWILGIVQNFHALPQAWSLFGLYWALLIVSRGIRMGLVALLAFLLRCGWNWGQNTFCRQPLNE